MNNIKWVDRFHDFFKEVIQYLSMSLDEQALYLEKKKRYRLARKKYIALDNYEKIIHISRRLHDYKSVFIYQVKNNQTYEAMQTADIYELYELGAPLCEKQGAFIKAAHMYSHFNLIKAASLYRQEHLWDKAAQCYIKSKQWIRAIECLEQISSEEIKEKLYEKITGIGNELTLHHNYEEAIKLYVRIGALEKALEISQKIDDQNTTLILHEQLAQKALNDNELEKAAHYFEQFDLSKAFTLYIKNQNIDHAAHLLMHQEKWEEALHLYLKNEREEEAIEFATKHNLYNLLLFYFKERKNYDKISWVYEQTHDTREAIKYFKEENRLDLVVHFAKKLSRPVETAEILKDIGYYEQAAQYYLLDGNKEECKTCLKHSGKTPAEIENYFFIKDYPA